MAVKTRTNHYEEVGLFRTADIEYEPIQRTVVYGLDSVPIQYE